MGDGGEEERRQHRGRLGSAPRHLACSDCPAPHSTAQHSRPARPPPHLAVRSRILLRLRLRLLGLGRRGRRGRGLLLEGRVRGGGGHLRLGGLGRLCRRRRRGLEATAKARPKVAAADAKLAKLEVEGAGDVGLGGGLGRGGRERGGDGGGAFGGGGHRGRGLRKEGEAPRRQPSCYFRWRCCCCCPCCWLLPEPPCPSSRLSRAEQGR